MRRDRRVWLTVVGAVLCVFGLVFGVIGATDAVPRPLVLIVFVAGLLVLAVSLFLGRRDREPGAEPDAPSATRSERRHSSAVRFVVSGFALPVLAIVVAAFAGNTTGAFGYAPPALLAIVFAVVVLTTGRAFLPALVVGVLMLLFSLAAGSSDLRHPESFADFVPTFLRVVGFALAIYGAASGLRGRRHGTLHRSSPTQRRAMRVGAVVVVLVGVASFVLTESARTTIRTVDGAIVVRTEGDEFEPDELHLDEGRVRVLVRNADSYAHSFTIDDLAIDEYIPPRSDKLLTLGIDVPSKLASAASRGIVLSCVVTGHEMMEGTVFIGD